MERFSAKKEGRKEENANPLFFPVPASLSGMIYDPGKMSFQTTITFIAFSCHLDKKKEKNRFLLWFGFVDALGNLKKGTQQNQQISKELFITYPTHRSCETRETFVVFEMLSNVNKIG